MCKDNLQVLRKWPFLLKCTTNHKSCIIMLLPLCMTLISKHKITNLNFPFKSPQGKYKYGSVCLFMFDKALLFWIALTFDG